MVEAVRIDHHIHFETPFRIVFGEVQPPEPPELAVVAWVSMTTAGTSQ